MTSRLSYVPEKYELIKISFSRLTEGLCIDLFGENNENILM